MNDSPPEFPGKLRSPPEFPGKLRAAGLSQTEFRELVERLAGQRISQTTTSRWVKGMRTPPPCALALLALVARIPPAELDRLLADRHPESPAAGQG